MRQLYPKVVAYFRAEMDLLDDPSLSEELNNLLEMAQTDDIPIDNVDKGRYRSYKKGNTTQNAKMRPC
jgi:hypothetical protein